MDVYSPPGPMRARSGVVLVHGGPLPRIGAKRMGVFVSYGELLAASGFAAVTFDHRFLGPDRLTDAGSDVADLLAHVRKNASSLGVDPARLALWAFSGGGPFLAAPLRERPAWLRTVVAYYAVLDLQQPPPGPDTGRPRRAAGLLTRPRSRRGRDGGATHPRRTGRPRRPVAERGRRPFRSGGSGEGATLDLLNHPDGRHGFDILDDDPRSKGIIRRTLAFLEERLGN